jgi:hypothetical protein
MKLLCIQYPKNSVKIFHARPAIHHGCDMLQLAHAHEEKEK